MTSPRTLLRAALLAVLAWQAALAARDLAVGVWTRASDGYAIRLTRPDEERVRRAFAAEAPTFDALRAALPTNAIVLTRPARDIEESALLQKLRHALYPVLVREVPVAMLEGPVELGTDRPVLLLDLDAERGGPPPGDRWVDPRPVGRFRLFRRRGG